MDLCMGRATVIVGAWWPVIVTQMIPHGIVEIGELLSSDGSALTVGDRSGWSCMEPIGANHARFKRVHVEITYQHSSLMSEAGFNFADLSAVLPSQKLLVCLGLP